MKKISSNYRFLVLDDHKIVLRGIYYLLKEHFQGAVIDLVSDEVGFLSKLATHDYSVVIMDLNLPDFDPVALLPNLLKKKPELKVLVYSMHLEHIFAKRMISLGTKGYIEKESEDTDLISAINIIMKGGIFVSPRMSASFFLQGANNDNTDQFEKLSAREFEVMKLLTRGYSSSKIVKILNIHPSTVSTHKNRIFQKLKVENLVELVQMTKECGIM